MFIKRTLVSALKKSSKSILLLGPRQTGKSTLATSLEPALSINLARESTYLEFASNPGELEERLGAYSGGMILIDEVQRLPSLLNTIQAILDENKKPFRFIITGSSARKLKRGKANLLPGRLHTYFLGPLTCQELAYEVDLKLALAYGSLPGIVVEAHDRERELTLKSYAATYLREEIQAEALTKNIEGFSRFIYVVAAEASHYLDLTKVASEASITRQSAVRFFEILEDTLIVQRCESFSKSNRRRLIQHPRFFFFDVGVLNGLLANFVVSADRKGILFEHFIFNQIIALAESLNENWRVSSYRTEHGAEVDLILETNDSVFALELKASTRVSAQDLRGLKSFQQYYGKPLRPKVLYCGDHKKIIDGIEVLPWISFFKELS